MNWADTDVMWCLLGSLFQFKATSKEENEGNTKAPNCFLWTATWLPIDFQIENAGQFGLL